MALYLGDKKVANVLAYVDKGIIEVEELPTENISEDRVYAVIEDGQYKGFYTREGGKWVNYEPPSGEDPTKYLEAQHQTVDLPNATAIKPYAFYLDATIRRINAPKVTTVGKYAFNGCEKFSMTTLPDTIESIGTYGFKACGSMALEKLPNSL